jgi:superfamily II DNA or RNA helicase
MKFKLNENHTKLILVESTREEYNQVKRCLSPYVNNYRFMPRYKLGVWDGKIDFFKNGHINFGLWHEVYEICKEYGYPFQVLNKEQFPKDHKLKKQDIIDFCEDFYAGYYTSHKKNEKGEIVEEGKPFFPYEHQIDAIFKLLKYKYGLVEIATAGGKSLVFATIVFYILRNIDPEAKFLLIVPNISLVTQFYDDLIDYNLGYNKENEEPLDINIQEIMSDKPRKIREGEEPNIYIGTYQSLEKYPLNFFKQFMVVGTDEAHRSKSKTIETILTKTFGTAQYRFGMSGTYPAKESSEFMTIESLMGPNLLTVKAKKLQEEGLISNLKIKALQLNYEEYNFAEKVFLVKKRGGGRQAFELEKEFIHNSERRKLFLMKLVSKFQQNSLVLFHSIEYGKTLYNFFRDNIGGKNFYYIDGQIKAKKRNQIKKIMEETTGAPKILVASYGTLSTGINIKAITNIVFTDSFKSDQIIRQSIGRGLRLHEEKDKLIVFDIVDRFSLKYKNTLYQHYLSRRNKIYKEQQYPYDELKIRL